MNSPLHLSSKKFPVRPGEKFGRLLVLQSAGKRGDLKLFLCRCSCGKERVSAGRDLRRGHVTSCGCLNRELARNHCLSLNVAMTKHGEARTSGCSAEYRTWRSMIGRCENANARHYSCYGGRGINVCQRWRNSFEDFLIDMGRKPTPKHTIDRYPDNDGDYRPGNCRWATRKQQQANRRNSRRTA